MSDTRQPDRGVADRRARRLAVGAVIALLSAFPHAIGTGQDAPAAILAVAAGATLIRQGHEPSGLYYLRNGHLTSQRAPPDWS